MKNIEIKARYPDLERAREIVRQLDARYEATYHQVDTYFYVQYGRFKLREFDDHPTQLIYYIRPDVAEPKASEYEIYPVTQAAQLKSMLSAALGVWKVVDKQREVYWVENVRIHLDQVRNLGNFLELEGVVKSKREASATETRVSKLLSLFHISKDALLTNSYSDLISK